MNSRQAWRLVCRFRGAGGGFSSASSKHRPYISHSLCHARQQQHSRLYTRTRNLLAEFKGSSSRFSATSSLCAAAAASAEAAAASGAARRGFVGWYLSMLEARPVLTKGITAGVIFVSADLSAQMITLAPLESFDLMRTSRMAGYGLMISGPSLHFWFNFLSKILPKRDVVNTLKKMFLGQTVYGPIANTVFFSLNAALQGESGAEIFARLKRDLPPTFINGLVYWPTCDFITFRFVPVRLQPLVSNSFSFIWTIYITYMASLKKAGTSETADA